MRRFILITLFFVFTLSSAQAVQKSPVKQFGQALPDKALAYFIRPAHLEGSLRTQFVYADQTFMAALDNKTYTFVYVEPGQHLIWTNWTSVQKNLEFIAGQTYYFYVAENVNLLNNDEGRGYLNSQELKFAQSTDKEIKKSASHIKNRYGRAVKKMEKDDYATLPFVDYSMALRPRAGAVLLAKGTPITLTLMENVSSSRVQAGQEISFEVETPVVQGGKTLISQGTSVKGIIHHVEHGKTGGVAGNLDVVVPTIYATDGNPLPIAGQVSIMGESRMGDATTNYLLFGLGGFFATKSREGFLLSQTQHQVSLKDNVYVVPSQKNPMPATRTTATNAQQAYTATIQKTVKFSPSKKTKVPDIQVELPAQFQWDKLTLVSAQGIPLPKHMTTTTKVKGNKKQIFVYPGWDIVRFLPLNLNAKDYKLSFLAESGGNHFPVMATLEVTVK